jgi:hypothetical protein
MSKKKSKSKKSGRRSQVARRLPSQRVEQDEGNSGSPLATTGAGGRSRSSGAKAISFEHEYAYVYQDLKLVAIIAAAMLVILVVLSFVIT